MGTAILENLSGLEGLKNLGNLENLEGLDFLGNPDPAMITGFFQTSKASISSATPTPQ